MSLLLLLRITKYFCLRFTELSDLSKNCFRLVFIYMYIYTIANPLFVFHNKYFSFILISEFCHGKAHETLHQSRFEYAVWQ